MRASYVSLQSALAHYDLIPEHVVVITSVTTARPARWDTPLDELQRQADLAHSPKLRRAAARAADLARSDSLEYETL